MPVPSIDLEFEVREWKLASHYDDHLEPSIMLGYRSEHAVEDVVSTPQVHLMRVVVHGAFSRGTRIDEWRRLTIRFHAI